MPHPGDARRPRNAVWVTQTPRQTDWKGGAAGALAVRQQLLHPALKHRQPAPQLSNPSSRSLQLLLPAVPLS